MSKSTETRLYDILRRGAALTPDRMAVTHGERQIVYRDLLVATAGLIDRLREHGIEGGARVGLLWENSIEYVTAFFAITGAGYVVVPLDSSLKPDKAAYILNDCGARALFVQGKLAREIDRIVPDDSTVKLLISDVEMNLSRDGVAVMQVGEIPVGSTADFDLLVEGIDEVMPLEGLDHRSQPNCPHELAAIFYTSGSTGTPKGVMLSHRNLISNTIATVEYLGLTAGDSIMLILPLYYIYGNSLMLTHALVGGRLVVDNRFAFPQVILKTMADQEVTGFSGVPSNFMFLLGKRGFDSASLPALRYLTQAGGAMAPEVIRRVMETFPDQQIFIMYGQTEASPRVSWLPPDRLAEKLGSIGIPVPGVTIEIVSPEGVDCPVDVVGEIAVRGDNVMLGYWNQPDEQADVLLEGRLFTGDLARRDADGFLWVVSRKKEIIKVGGNRVSAREVEECLLEHEAVGEAAVISVPDDILGEAIKAFIVTREGASVAASDLKDHCRIRLAMHKAPKHIKFIDALPKHHSGKINKLALSKV